MLHPIMGDVKTILMMIYTSQSAHDQSVFKLESLRKAIKKSNVQR